MRKFGLAMMTVLATGLAIFGNVAPANARDYPWCIQGWGWGYPGDCSYQTHAQCLASASGRNVSCGMNPRFAFARAGRRQHIPRGW